MTASSPQTALMPPLTRNQVREVDRIAIEEYGLPGLVLMENAGRNAAEHLINLGISGRITICCGKGNNGGDGFVIARHLENRGFAVKVLLCAPASTATGDAAVNLKVLQVAGTPIKSPPLDWDQELAGSDWIIDALLGTGTAGTIREPFVSCINAINRSNCRVYAVDLPSGLDCDTGEPLGVCIRADHTATFVAPKIGFSRSGAANWVGQVQVIDIGVPRTLLQQLLTRSS
ncbi:NAD(P)H-hydrate epimerase [Schlesneria sp.]|uniref:NAD(P)H-hydrate epimerase n=1 Tax=Schlesneria sp. TaxID=2762018 RepID=UPI002F00A82A